MSLSGIAVRASPVSGSMSVRGGSVCRWTMGKPLLLLSWLLVQAAALPSLVLRQGRLSGLHQPTLSGRTVSAFLGIPYARPPIGNLRFKAPEPAGGWPGTLNATRQPADCLQYSHLTYHFPYCPVTGAEDCLYLNVYTPWRFTGSDPSELMDVIVFIHPGSWMYYGVSYQGPEALLEHDLVLVTINYRLGPLGFLSTGDSVVPGNNGLKDQVLALKWVQSNIQAFGGDPGRVTIAGLSAGGASVHYHLLSPTTKGLFSRAISASGTTLCPWALAEKVPQKSAEIASQLGCPTSPSRDMVDCLRARPGHAIVGLAANFMPWLYNPYSPFGPVVEPESPDAFISKHPAQYLHSGEVQSVPWLVSFVSEEGLYPAAEILGWESYMEELEERWDELLPYVLDYDPSASGVARAARDQYKADLTSRQGINNFIKMVGERLYLSGISDATKLHVKASNAPVYMYGFSYKANFSVSDVLTKFRGKERRGVCHGDDLLHLFPTPWFPETDLSITKLLSDIWAKFASTGKLDWDPVGQEGLTYLHIKGPDDFKATTVESLADSVFWSSFKLDQNSPDQKDEL